MRDIRVVELGEDLPLDLEARLHGAAEGAALHHFDGDLLLELGIRALGEEDLAHAADTQRAEYAVGSDTLSFHSESMLPRPGRRQTGASLRPEAATVYEVASAEHFKELDMPNENDPSNPKDPGSGSGSGRGTGSGSGSGSGRAPARRKAPDRRAGFAGQQRQAAAGEIVVAAAVGGLVGGLVGALIGSSLHP